MNNDGLLVKCANCNAELEDGGRVFMGHKLCAECFKIFVEETEEEAGNDLANLLSKKDAWH